MPFVFDLCPERCRPRARWRRFARGCAAAAVLFASPLAAEQVWSIQLLGLEVGELRMTESRNGQRYTGSGVFSTRGLARAVKSVHFEVTADGTLRDGRYRTRSYSGDINTGRRSSRTELDFSGTVPVKVRGRGEPAVPIGPDDLNGTVDPLTGLLITFQDLPKDQLCKLDQTVFDGTRVARLRLTGRDDGEGEVACSGVYIRVAGYAPDELAEIRQAPLTIYYAPKGDKWRPVRVRAKTRFGKASFLRRD